MRLGLVLVALLSLFVIPPPAAADEAWPIATSAPSAAALPTPPPFDPTVGGAFQTADTVTIDVVEIKGSKTTHKFFMARWDALDFANAAIVPFGWFDACQTSCRFGFLNGPALCNPGGECTAVTEATSAARPCTGKDKWLRNASCTLVVVGAKVGLEQIFGKHWSKADRNFDAALTVTATGVYVSATLGHNNDVLKQQYHCPPGTRFYDPIVGACR